MREMPCSDGCVVLYDENDDQNRHESDISDYYLGASRDLTTIYRSFIHEHKPFVPREARLMENAVQEDVPVLGLCFGGQMLARVLGGEVSRGDVAEIGWLPVHTTDPELVPEGPWFQWHFDNFTTPPGATLIAESDVGPQAFVAGRSLGLQFHPEVTPEIMHDWVRAYRHELDEEGVDPDALLAETDRNANENRRTALRLLERYLDQVARLGSAAIER